MVLVKDLTNEELEPSKNLAERVESDKFFEECLTNLEIYLERATGKVGGLSSQLQMIIQRIAKKDKLTTSC